MPVARHVAALVELDAELLEQRAALGTGEAHGEEDVVRAQLQRSLPGTGLKRPSRNSTSTSFEHGIAALAVVDEAHGVDREPPPKTSWALVTL